MEMQPTFRQLLISIHALREEGDQELSKKQGEALDISIHALREEGDPTTSWTKASSL